MKISTTQLLFTLTFLVGLNGFIFSQVKTSFLKDCLWIKGNEANAFSVDSINSNSENLLKKTLNFNSVVDFSKDKINKKYKNLITKKGSLFVVFRSNHEDENILLTVQRGITKSILTTKKMQCDKDILLNKGNPKTGVLVSYLFNKNSLLGKRNGSLAFDDLIYNDTEFKNQLIELIYIPNYLNDKEKNTVETYLAIKYGISLNDENNYYNAKGDKVWDAKENKEFNKHVTGIGREDVLLLNQKQSSNSLQDGLTIGIDKIKLSNGKNKSLLSDNTFIMWGDNGKNTLLEKQTDNAEKRIKRIWKVIPSSTDGLTYKTQIKFDKKRMLFERSATAPDRDFMWIAIDSTQSTEFNYTNAKYIKATSNDEKEIVFDNVKFNTKANYLFTVVKAPEYLISQMNSTSKTDSNNQPSSDYVLFPNPVVANEKFAIQFNLNDPSEVSIQITDVNGKIIKSKDLGTIDKSLYNESLSASGTYLVLVSINGIVEANKLIVK